MRRISILVPVVVLLLSNAQILRADPPKVLDFRVQEVNQKLYFHLRIERPGDMVRDEPRRDRRWGWDPFNMEWVEPASRPRLVPQDGGARLVYTRERIDEG